MRAWDELVERCAAKRAASLGGLSADAHRELVRAIRKDPEAFIDDDAEAAFFDLSRALERFEADSSDDDLLDDSEYLARRTARRAEMASACKDALGRDGNCLDARLLLALSQEEDINEFHARLAEVYADAEKELARRRAESSQPDDLWADPFCRPALRAKEAFARSCLVTGRIAQARTLLKELMDSAPGDELGAGLSLALAHARMEDEDGLEALDRRQGRRGNAWMHLARTLLLYKLDRMDAAARALEGYRSMCAGGAYILLRPFYVDIYMPDRPQFMPGSVEETILAVHEADPIIMDSPDFVSWASEQPGCIDDARAFAAQEGLDW